MTDQELKDLVASLAISQAKTDEQINNEAKEIKALRQFQQEVTQQMRETDKQMKETDKQIKETSKKVDDTTATIKSIGIQLGNIGKNQGAVAEEFFVNSLSSSLTVGGIEYDELNKNMHKRTKKAQGEFDIVLINGKDIAIIEIKYKAHNDDLEDLIDRKYANFKLLYPQYANYTHHLGLASFYIDEDLKQKALKNNVFILQRKGEIIESFLP